LSPLHDVAAQGKRVAEQVPRVLDRAAQHEPRMWLDETTSPSTSSSCTIRVSKRLSAASNSESPCARWPKRKFSPTETWVAESAPTRTSSMNCCALRAAKSRSNG